MKNGDNVNPVSGNDDLVDNSIISLNEFANVFPLQFWYLSA